MVESVAGPHRLEAQDTTLSRWRRGFEFRWGHRQFINTRISIDGMRFVFLWVHRQFIKTWVPIEGMIFESLSLR